LEVKNEPTAFWIRFSGSKTAVRLSGTPVRACELEQPDALAAGPEPANGTLEVQLTPQGTLSEAIRAGGAGIGAFYLQPGVGTKIAEGREVREIGGVRYLLWHALHTNVALIKARRADALGNLVYEKTARNFNPDMATAADLVIAEVDEIVAVGELDPESVVTPHLLVDHLVLSDPDAATGEFS
jgi:3-oxoacid CoA-transferase A subunit